VPVLGVAEGQIVTTSESAMFAEEWAAAWNRRDVDAVLAHFHDDIVFTSPVAAQLVPDSGRVVRGKAALRHGRPDRCRHAAYLLVMPVMAAYLTLK